MMLCPILLEFSFQLEASYPEKKTLRHFGNDNEGNGVPLSNSKLPPDSHAAVNVNTKCLHDQTIDNRVFCITTKTISSQLLKMCSQLACILNHLATLSPLS